MPKAIPPRQPLNDPFAGALVSIEDAPLLAAEGVTLPKEALIIARGRLYIRYGVRYLGKPHLSIVPDLVVVDYGDMLNGEEAWQFILKRSNLYPRAEVFGYRSDGRDEMIPIKLLDLALPCHVFVYESVTATAPIGKAAALIIPRDTAINERLATAIPRFDTFAAWRSQAQVRPGT